MTPGNMASNKSRFLFIQSKVSNITSYFFSSYPSLDNNRLCTEKKRATSIYSSLAKLGIQEF